MDERSGESWMAWLAKPDVNSQGMYEFREGRRAFLVFPNAAGRRAIIEQDGQLLDAQEMVQELEPRIAGAVNLDAAVRQIADELHLRPIDADLRDLVLGYLRDPVRRGKLLKWTREDVMRHAVALWIDRVSAEADVRYRREGQRVRDLDTRISLEMVHLIKKLARIHRAWERDPADVPKYPGFADAKWICGAARLSLGYRLSREPVFVRDDERAREDEPIPLFDRLPDTLLSRRDEWSLADGRVDLATEVERLMAPLAPQLRAEVLRRFRQLDHDMLDELLLLHGDPARVAELLVPALLRVVRSLRRAPHVWHLWQLAAVEANLTPSERRVLDGFVSSLTHEVIAAGLRKRLGLVELFEHLLAHDPRPRDEAAKAAQVKPESYPVFKSTMRSKLVAALRGIIRRRGLDGDAQIL